MVLGVGRRLVGSRWLWFAVFVAAAGLFGYAIGSVYGGGSTAEAVAFPIAGGLAAATAAAGSWWLLLALPGSYGAIRGALAGAVAGIAAYPLFFAFGLGLKEVVAGTPERLGFALVVGFLFGVTYGLFGIVLFGWLTAGIGTLVGALVGHAAAVCLDD